MARISGINVPTEKQVGISLTYVYGIGPKTALEVLESCKVDTTTRVKDLTEDELSRIRGYIENNLVVEGDLQRKVTSNIKRLKDIGSYRGERHKKRLPSRGQRTRTNARTKRGKKLAVGGSQPKSATKT